MVSALIRVNLFILATEFFSIHEALVTIGILPATLLISFVVAALTTIIEVIFTSSLPSQLFQALGILYQEFLEAFIGVAGHVRADCLTFDRLLLQLLPLLAGRCLQV